MDRLKHSIDFIEEIAAAGGQKRKIDQQVYELYGLTPEEIKTVER